MRTSLFVATLSAVTAVLCSSFAPASAADLLRHRHSRFAGDIYPEDYGCRQQEPSVYRPRTLNYSEPLCFAARPYGISTHLYDHPRELSDYNSAAGY